ncbi:fasciclin domain-containing protein [Costertonia aggregata]|uniref:Fasciclin domain-containing protein n=1 Tax=Costertonia aggregata TaxID=343403 RepID=A0A7H9ANG1_9FLAO|nr:fasciclin domain-containing protein [Costertonia aggregata]QLG44976.1 fasciclin domain-containing protein [Costertonia aggregata]
MKKRTTRLVITALTFFTMGFTALAQWNGNDVFSKIDNTSEYGTFELAHMDRDISTFINLVALSGLEPSLLMADEHTVFIPTNEAFKAMQIDEFLHLTNPENKMDLIKFVKYHFLPNKVMKYDFKDSQVIDVEGANDITVSVDEPYDTTYIGGARIIKDDIETSNGIIHIVDRVIMPSDIALNE